MNDENTNTKSSKAQIIANLTAQLSNLKQSNPKLFFGGIAVLVIGIVILFSGGDSNNIESTKMANITRGKTYELRVINSYDPESTVRLVAIPGSLGAYDDTEVEDRVGCMHLPRGTKVKVLDLQKAFESANFVKVEILSGECIGKMGWTMSTNIQ